MIKLNIDLLEKSFPKTNKDVLKNFCPGLIETCDEFDIDFNIDRMASFLAQIGHESGDFYFLEENLMYSAIGLHKIFPKYFNNQNEALIYANKPESIANKVYANRMGNNNEASGDGWKFRGRGLIQLTGKYNYERFGQFISDPDLDKVISYLETPNGACYSAGWYWDNNNLNELADKKEITKMTRVINGGTHGLQDRLNRYNYIFKVLK